MMVELTHFEDFLRNHLVFVSFLQYERNIQNMILHSFSQSQSKFCIIHCSHLGMSLILYGSADSNLKRITSKACYEGAHRDSLMFTTTKRHPYELHTA
jgi:hypothetical protein